MSKQQPRAGPAKYKKTLPGGPIEPPSPEPVKAFKPGGPIPSKRRGGLGDDYDDEEEEYVSVNPPPSKKRPVAHPPPPSSKRMLASAGDLMGAGDSDEETESEPDGNRGTGAVGSGAYPRSVNHGIENIPAYRNPNQNRALRFLQELASYMDVTEAELYRDDVDPDEFEKPVVQQRLAVVDVFEFLAANCTASVVGSIRRAWRLIGGWLGENAKNNPMYSNGPDALSRAIADDKLFEILAEVTAWIMRDTKLQTLQRGQTLGVMDKHKWDTIFLAGKVRTQFGFYN